MRARRRGHCRRGSYLLLLAIAILSVLARIVFRAIRVHTP